MLAALALAFIVVPLAELAVIVAVADRVGVLNTIALLLAVSVAGSILARREGLGVWLRFRESLARGEVPSAEIMDGFLVLLGAALLLTPGFLTDVVGLMLLVPMTRTGVKAIARSASRSYLDRRLERTSRRRGPRRVEVVRITTTPSPSSSGGTEEAQPTGPSPG